ncbi:hypothetical protein [Ponticaulis sp.]|uniref:hypothetical protein n=1 Tax=Ponticaulis sp. TaxID=2020902 RepID=UPI00260F8520|nr:hypothetical protein [Ponticaulis sp.]MDF1679729.1 hypothetical protein [Ponticaulis sp.]
MSETATEIQSYEPRDIAQRLKAYICRAASLAEAHFEEPAQNVRHSEGASSPERVPCGPTGPREQNKQAGGQTSEVSPERVLCDPRGSREQTKMIQHCYHTAMMEHVKRLEYVLRCFILFLAGELIALGRVTASAPRTRAKPAEKSLVQKQDETLRDQLRDLPRLNSFSVLTPVVEGKGRGRSYKRSYTFLPDSLRLVDAGHLLARFNRLSSVLTRVDKMAMSLAARALRPSLIPVSSPERVPCEPTGSREQIERAGGQTGEASPERVLCGPTGSREQNKHELPNPLYYEPLAHFCPPEDLWASAHDEVERRDVNFIHYMAAAKLEEIGYGIRPDPYAGLPDLSCVDPPDPPRVRSL